MVGRIWRQRWRVVVGGGLWAWVLAMMIYGFDPAQPWTDPFGLWVLMLLCVAGGLAMAGIHAALAAVLAPSWLGAVEVVPLAAIVVNLLPDPAWPAALEGIGPMVWIFLFTFATFRLVYGPHWLRLPRGDGAVWHRRFIVDAPPEDVWRRVAPLPGHDATYWWTGSTFRPAPTGAAHQVDSTWAMRNGKPSTQNTRIEALDPLRHIRVTGTDGTDAMTETTEIRLTPLPYGKTEVDFRSQIRNQPLGGRLYYALGCYGEDYLDCLQARVTGRPDRSITGRLIPRAAPARPRGPWDVSAASGVPAQ
jgi:uncharacterized protein YndB with AHSA1/START domain